MSAENEGKVPSTAQGEGELRDYKPMTPFELEEFSKALETEFAAMIKDEYRRSSGPVVHEFDREGKLKASVPQKVYDLILEARKTEHERVATLNARNTELSLGKHYSLEAINQRREANGEKLLTRELYDQWLKAGTVVEMVKASNAIRAYDHKPQLSFWQRIKMAAYIIRFVVFKA